MEQKNTIQIFENKKVRTLWDEENEKWYLSIIDVIAVLTDQPNFQRARNYWKVLKHRLVKEGNETVTNCNRLKMEAEDGKMRITDVADTEQLFRLIQSEGSQLTTNCSQLKMQSVDGKSYFTDVIKKPVRLLDSK